VLDFLFGDRFDFLGLGPGSTNRSAAILSCALVSCAWLFLQPRRRGHWFGLIFALGLAALLVATKSRGGLIAAGCGIGLIGLINRPRISRSLLVGGAAAIFVLVVYGTHHGVWHRFTFGDDSRSGLWRAGLAMLWDAPCGVGRGSAANFFAQWYQEVGDRRDYLTLVNFHLNWLVEHGVAARVGYALAWSGLAWFVWPMRRTNAARPAVAPCLASAAAVWLTFFVAAIFNTTANVWQVWVLPLGWLVAVAVWRIRDRLFASPRVAVFCAAAGVLALAALHCVGWCLSARQISSNAHGIRWGEGSPRVVLYDPSHDILGRKWGHDVRASGETVHVLYAGAPVPEAVSPATLWVLSGVLPDALPSKARVLMLNIPASALTLTWLEDKAPAAVTLVLSDSLCSELRCEDWLKWSDRHPEAKVRVLGGTGLYVPDWMQATE
jgi:hypothetical protein